MVTQPSQCYFIVLTSGGSRLVSVLCVKTVIYCWPSNAIFCYTATQLAALKSGSTALLSFFIAERVSVCVCVYVCLSVHLCLSKRIVWRFLFFFIQSLMCSSAGSVWSSYAVCLSVHVMEIKTFFKNFFIYYYGWNWQPVLVPAGLFVLLSVSLSLWALVGGRSHNRCQLCALCC